MKIFLTKSAMRLFLSFTILYALGYMFVGASNLVQQMSAEQIFKSATTANVSGCSTVTDEFKSSCINREQRIDTVNKTDVYKKYANSAIFSKPFITLTKDDVKEEFINRMAYTRHVAGIDPVGDEYFFEKLNKEAATLIDTMFEITSLFTKPSLVAYNAIYWFILISAVIAIMSLVLTAFKREQDAEFSEAIVKNLILMNDRWFFIMFAALFTVRVHVNFLL